MTSSLNIDPDERKLWEKALFKYLKSTDKFSDDTEIRADIKVKLNRAIQGWDTKCPQEFDARLRQVFSIKKQDFLLHFIRDGELDRYAPSEDVVRRDEEAYMKLRRSHYTDEYELDQSGDQALLEIVLLTELRLYRISQDVSKNPSLRVDYSGQIDKIERNLVSALKALGITREQRQMEQKVPQGSVANLSLKFEEKLKELRKVKEEEITVEKLLTLIKSQKETVNKVTEGDLEGILRVMEKRKSS